MISVITTVLRVDEQLWKSVSSVRSEFPLEHIITVCMPGDPVGRGWKWPSHVQLCAVPGCGISQGFNAAIERCSGDFVFVLNSGDRVLSFDPLVNHLLAHPTVDLAYGDIIYDRRRRFAPRELRLARVLRHGLGFCHGAMLTRMTAHHRFGLYHESFRICMDMEFVCRALAKGAVFEYVNAQIAEIAPAGVSGRIWARSAENAAAVRPYIGYWRSNLLRLKWASSSWIAGLLHR